MIKRKSRRSKLLVLARLLTVGALLFLGCGAYIAWQQHQANQAPAPLSSPTAVTSSSTAAPPKTDKPSEDTFTKYQVPPNAPRYLFIPKIGVRAMVRPVGLTPKNEIDVPQNVFDAGWFTRSAKPGQSGATIIDGHIISWDVHGVFYDIRKLRTGDIITVQRGDNVTLSYKVVKSHLYDAGKVDMKAALAPVTATKPGLNIITCAGKVVKGTTNFDKRIVVFAEQM